MPIDSHFPAIIDVTTLNGINGFNLTGECIGSALSGNQDINQDGIADLIIGASLANSILPDGSKIDSGGMHESWFLGTNHLTSRR